MIRDIHSLTEAEQAAHRKTFGGYNDFPPNWKPLDPADEHWFWSMFMSYSPNLIEYRQMYNKKSLREPCTSAKLYFFHAGEGIAFVSNIQGSCHVAPKLYRFASCEHEWRSVPAESHMCYHVSKCRKCGAKQAIDSSD